MSATERIRAMLDERGVEWMPVAWSPKRETFYHAANGVGFCADEYTDGVKIYTDSTITPEQAVEATLGDADATGERQRDAVEVVRCRDCERFAVDQSDHDYRSGWWCHRWNTDMVKPDGFCAWGERRDA